MNLKYIIKINKTFCFLRAQKKTLAVKKVLRINLKVQKCKNHGSGRFF